MIVKLFILGLLALISSETSTTLTVEIRELRNNEGLVHLKLVNENDVTVDSASQKIINNTCLITLKNLPSGKYAFQYFHDEDQNKELDTNWLGIPQEGFGFSNVPSITFGPPSLDEMLFLLTNDSLIVCKPQYIM